MPCRALFQYALPFDDWNTKRKLIKKFKLSKLPAIVLLESDGTVSNSKAYNAMLSSPNEFPWKPQTIDSLLQRGLINPKNASIDPAVLKGKKIGLYFSANWCPPCRKFSPQLVETYKALKEKKVDFEIVFVSNDESEQKFFEYFGQQMPWLAIPYSDVAGRAMLQDELEITSLPSLVILDENRQVINKNGRRAIETDLEGQNFPWVPKVVQDISESVDGLYENPSLIVFMEDAGKDTQEQVKRDLLQLAEQLNASEENPRKLSFFIVTNTNPQSVGMRRLFKLPILMQATDSVTKQNSAKPCMV
ncbi:apicoplast-associated thioredoxin family protein Atrx1 [Cardiosporidium cionae]|uniref:Apicoplast-associated thioredoxin family protein Atrx1 n=1 Tax=Cardiosporidium cionae TaxID=476202 RepID=A0ABQ7JGF1_9APIC|nr:apicoplast-associated thioredoxin family protein Atrx1 [Cardiosporidium cionae]|eukprot:KAF8822730.1 apicoplast-associated thioredoxin family protein Atrx1 [Cardiosporidium cionae]